MTTLKLKGIYLLDSMHIYLFADVTLKNKQLGDVWLVSACPISGNTNIS